jgi:hypothetical protein
VNNTPYPRKRRCPTIEKNVSFQKIYKNEAHDVIWIFCTNKNENFLFINDKGMNINNYVSNKLKILLFNLKKFPLTITFQLEFFSINFRSSWIRKCYKYVSVVFFPLPSLINVHSRMHFYIKSCAMHV